MCMWYGKGEFIVVFLYCDKFYLEGDPVVVVNTISSFIRFVSCFLLCNSLLLKNIVTFIQKYLFLMN